MSKAPQRTERSPGGTGDSGGFQTVFRFRCDLVLSCTVCVCGGGIEQKGVIFDILLAPIKIKISLILSFSFLGIQLLISYEARSDSTFAKVQNPHS